MSNEDLLFPNNQEEDDLFADTSGEDDLFADADGDGDLFGDADEEGGEGEDDNQDLWKVIIVDDEAEIHNVTRFALGDYRYQGKKLRFLDAYSGADAKKMIQDNPDTALMFLDVVMESQDAGLKVVEYIRNELQNHFLRIVMRTGQPGQAPEEEVIVKYDINDYKNKTELTDKKLFTTVTTSLRSYADIMEIESFRQTLEFKVFERTKEIEEKNKQLFDKNQQIISSITYAQRIQEAMLPFNEEVKNALPNSFILFRPRDIVSGDFYWFEEKDNQIIVSAIDCTGHGVPGAFMSMMGDAYLHQIINVDDISSPDMILNELHKRIRSALKQEEGDNRDGMDLAICVYDRNTRILEFAGAKNPVVYIQDNEIKQIKGDRTPIGGLQKEEERIFTKHQVHINQVTTVYLFSDGFPDQFGGPQNKKFMIRRFRELLFEIHQKPFDEQKRILETTIDKWIGDGENKQTDDILVMGFRIEP